MQSLYGVTMRVTCDTATVLAILKKNKEEHSSIVKEAREGFLKKCAEVLQAELANVQAGKTVRSLKLEVAAPEDHTPDYDTIITMLTLHKTPSVDLNADEVRQFIQDNWDWTNRFLASNSRYSGTAAAKFAGA